MARSKGPRRAIRLRSICTCRRYRLPPLLLSVGRDACVQTHAVDPCARVAASLELLKSFPKVDEHLFEKVSHLILVLGEHIANRVDGALLLLDELGKLLL